MLQMGKKMGPKCLCAPLLLLDNVLVGRRAGGHWAGPAPPRHLLSASSTAPPRSWEAMQCA